MNNKTLTDQVQSINNLLEAAGAIAVQKKPSLGNRPELYGYIPQFVFDAVSAILGPEKWSHSVDNSWHKDEQFMVQVTVTIGEASHTQFGESRIVRPKNGKGDGDVGSAAKGAVTDAIQKCFALFGIGSKAYRGELKKVFKSGVSTNKQGSESAHFSTLTEAARELKGDVEKGRSFWKANMLTIHTLSDSERTDLARILQEKKE